RAHEYDQVGMITGGTGIMPIYEILECALKDPSNKTKFTLIFTNISERDILLREEFDVLKKVHLDMFNVIYTLDQPRSNWKGTSCLADGCMQGFVNRKMIKQNIALMTLSNKVKVSICGLPGQVSTLTGKKDGMKQGTLSGILKDLRYTKDQV
ncbi:ferredoxin reductase-like protein, partial [Laetiporus sulphureus 93-53]